jgi:hypothetical protein
MEASKTETAPFAGAVPGGLAFAEDLEDPGLSRRYRRGSGFPNLMALVNAAAWCCSPLQIAIARPIATAARKPSHDHASTK